MNTLVTARRAVIWMVFSVVFLGLASIPRVRAAAPWYVATTGNDANTCASPAAPCATINGAIGKAGRGDTIYVATGVYTGTGSERVLRMWVDAVNLSGGWDSAFNRQAGFSILDGEKQRAVALIYALGQTVKIDRFIFQNGFGGLYTYGTFVVMTNCVVRDNRSGGGVYVASSYLTGYSLTMNNCSLTGNQHIGSTGGAITTYDDVFLNNVTISDNYADAGGALAVYGRAWINNSTIAGNTAGLYDGGGIVNRGTITIKNSILAGNVARFYDGGPTASDCVTEGGTWLSNGYNLVGTLSGCGFTPTTGDLVDTDPQLGEALGLPSYRPLLPGSPALNAGTPTGCTDVYGNLLSYDIRGMPRVGPCDIGSYEVGLSLVKAVSKILNNTATYTIQLRNEEGLSPLSDLVLTDTLPSSTTYVPNSLSFINGSGVVSGSTITWTGSVSGSTPTTVSFGVQVNPQLIATNVVTVGWANATFTAGATLGAYRSFLPLTRKGQAVPARACPISYFDDFSDPASGWLVGDDSYARVEYLNSEYRILTQQAGYFYWVRAPLACDLPYNYIVEVDARWDGTPGSSYGLVLNLVPDGQYFHIFDINTDLQQYRVLAHTPLGWIETAPLTTSAAILPGNGTNHLKVLVNGAGGYMTLIVNGTVLIDKLPPSLIYTRTPRVGLSSVSYPNQLTSDARFDNFRLTVLPPFELSAQGTQTASSDLDRASTPETGHISPPVSDLTWK